MATDPKDFHLKITAGPSYDASKHSVVAVNTDQPLQISNSKIDASLAVRIQNYRGLPSASPASCSYFEKSPHTSDLYSISFRFKPVKDIPGSELVFGNDFASPIRDSLPTGFGAALKFVKWGIDPGLDGDVYAEKPYLYGPLLSSINVLHIGDKADSDKHLDVSGEVLQEGASGSGAAVREQHSLPAASAQRMKHFLNEQHRKDFVFEAGREYSCDFFNGYLDFNDLSLKLPVATLHLMRFWDGQPLRYVLKQRNKDGSVDEELIVIVFSLVRKEEAEKEAQKEDSSTKPSDTSDATDGKFQDADVD